MYEKPKRNKPQVTIIEPEITKFNNWSLEELEKEYEKQYLGYRFNTGDFASFSQMKKLAELINKRKTQQQLKKLFDEVI